MRSLLKHFVGEESDPEHSQSITRVAVVATVAVVTAFGAQFGDLAWDASGLAFAYLIVSAGWLAFVSRYPGHFPARRVLMICCDLGLVALGAHFLGPISPFFYPVLLWIVVANGARYGVPYLLLAMALGVTAVLSAVNQSENWRDHIPLGIGLSIGLVVLPSFYVVLVNRLHKVQAQLEAELKKSLYAANHDSLTGLRNRPSFLELLTEEVRRATRYEQSFAVLFVDLNEFKRINDDFGHAAGDEALATIARALARSVRESDHVARLGGDEFAVLLLGSVTQTDREVVCERIRHEIAGVALGAQLTRSIGPIGASIGVSRFPEDAETGEELLRFADREMYAEKTGDSSASART